LAASLSVADMLCYNGKAVNRTIAALATSVGLALASPSVRAEAPAARADSSKGGPASAALHVPVPQGYVAFSSVPLSKQGDGMLGWLVLLQDQRLREHRTRQQFLGGGYCELDQNKTADVCTGGPVRSAVVLLVDANQQVLDSTTLEREVADLAMTERLYGTRKLTHVLTLDCNTGAGQLAGPCALFVEIEQGKLHWLDTIATEDGRRGQLRFISAPLRGWKLVPRPDGKGKEFLRWETDYIGGGGVYYFRYAWDGTNWMQRYRVSPGHRTSDEPFPSRKFFP
jgi:hypothetical protein